MCVVEQPACIRPLFECLESDLMDKVIYSSSGDTDTPANAVTRGVESASGAMHNGIDKVATPVRHAIDTVSSTAHDTVNRIAGSATSTAERFSEQARRVTEAPGKALEGTKSWIQGKPLEAVGAALAIGYILGRLTSR